MLEACLQTILVAAELQGKVTLRRKEDLHIKRSDEDLLEACLGPLIAVLKGNSKDSDAKEFFNLLTRANDARRLLVHRFFTENALDLLNEAGRRAINDQLAKLYLHIRQAHTAADALRESIYTQSGLTEEKIQQRITQLKADFGNDDASF